MILFWVSIVSFVVTTCTFIVISLFFYRFKNDKLTEEDYKYLDHLDKKAEEFNSKYPGYYCLTGVEIMKILTFALLIPYINVFLIALSFINYIWEKIFGRVDNDDNNSNSI